MNTPQASKFAIDSYVSETAAFEKAKINIFAAKAHIPLLLQNPKVLVGYDAEVV